MAFFRKAGIARQPGRNFPDTHRRDRRAPLIFTNHDRDPIFCLPFWRRSPLEDPCRFLSYRIR